MPTLVLLHGAWHGSWCWAPLQAELAPLGIGVVTVDLPADEPGAGIERYVETVCRAIEGDDPVIVVAHSFAGLIAPVVAERVNAHGLIMLAALWPAPGRSAHEQARSVPGIYTQSYRLARMVRRDDGGTEMAKEAALDLLYHDCEPAVALAACDQLRPQHWGVWDEPSPLATWPRIPTAGLVCGSDRMLGEEGMRLGAERASASLTWLDCGHSPMLSTPRVLAGALEASVREFAGSR